MTEEIDFSLQSNQEPWRPYAYVISHEKHAEKVASFMNPLAKEYHLNYYYPWEDRFFRENKEQGVYTHKILKTMLENQEKFATNPLASVVFVMLSPSTMSDLYCLTALLASQVGRKTSLPVVAIILEDVPLEEGLAYENLKRELEGESVEPPSFQNKVMGATYDPKEDLKEILPKMLQPHLKNMYEKLTNSSVTGSYPHSSEKTLHSWGKFHIKRVSKFNKPLPVFLEKMSKQLCYSIFKEVINSFNCNYIYLNIYEKKDSLMNLFMGDLTKRLENSITGSNNPFSVAKPIALKHEKFYFRQYEKVVGDLSGFHRVMTEECIIQGDKLVKLNSPHPRVMIPFSIREIGEKAMQFLTGLEEIILPEGVRVIGKQAFDACINLKRVYLPQSLKELQEDVWNGCFRLEYVNLPVGIQVIPERAFFGCDKLEETILPVTVKELGEASFLSCLALKKISLPMCIGTIKDAAFEGSGLEEITIPSSVTEFGKAVFENCYDLKKVIFRSKIDLSEDTFKGCVNLEELQFPSNMSWNETLFCDSPHIKVTIYDED